MPDLGILEILIAFFLFMPLCRPYLKSFAMIDGFAWFPPIALLCTAALFPAFGMRPECLPLLVYAVICNIINTRSLSASISKLRYSADAERSPVYFVIMLICLVAAVGIAVYFLPYAEARLVDTAREFRVISASNQNEYTVRVYDVQEGSGSRDDVPFVLVVPPAAGSIQAVDKVCGALSKEGVTAASFSRLGFDIPAVSVSGRGVYPKPEMLFKFFTSIAGKKNARMIESGAYFENERIVDIEYITGLLKAEYGARPFFIVGYGAGGSALALLASSVPFVSAHPMLRGGVMVESRLNSLYDSSGAVKQALPETLIPLASVSALADEDMEGGAYYAALYAFIKQNEDLVTRISFPGIGRADFSDVPEKYPVIAALLHGKGKRAWSDMDCVQLTARVIMDFVDAQMELFEDAEGTHEE
ncbi:MAG: hypothetical protein LBC77_06190 [Spirochaetaceae bacterium]|jgi:dienelactone hydrolase|nr:hypothetical protein [Spirochaetaceae bacterium]